MGKPADTSIEFAISPAKSSIRFFSAAYDASFMTLPTLLKRGGIASELELVLPFELQRDLIRCDCRMQNQQEPASRHDQPLQ